jgi:hypothetical protein
MVRITKTEERGITSIIVDGQLSADSIEMIESMCDQVLVAGMPVHLFLRDVSTVDTAGRELLSRLSGKGVRLQGSGVYTSYVVKAATKSAHAT